MMRRMKQFIITVLATVAAAAVFAVLMPADAATAADWELPFTWAP